MQTYEGGIQMGEGVIVRATIGDIDDPGWLGQIDLASVQHPSTFEPGKATVMLIDGARAGEVAVAHVDAGGALSGEVAFSAPTR